MGYLECYWDVHHLHMYLPPFCLRTSQDVSHSPNHCLDVLGHPRISAIRQTTAKSQPYFFFLSWDILKHPGMSAIRQTTAQSQAYLSFLSWDILEHPGMSAIRQTSAQSQAYLSFLS